MARFISTITGMAVLLAYLAASFVILDFNPAHWPEGARIAVVVGGLFGSIASLPALPFVADRRR